MLAFVKSHKFSIILLIFITFFAYINVYQNDFLSDDLEGIVKNRDIGDLPLAIKTLVPVNIINSLIFVLFGLSKPAYHLINVTLHVLNVLLIYLLLNILEEKSKSLALPTALIFALHPIHTEAVTWISGKPYSLYTFFILLSLIFFIIYSKTAPLLLNTKYLILSSIFYLLALLTSEKAIVLPILLILYLFVFKKTNKFVSGEIRPFLPSLAIFVLVTGIYGLTFLTRLPQRVEAVNPSYTGGPQFYNPFLQIPMALSSYLELSFVPTRLTFYHEAAYTLKPIFIARVIVTILYFVATLIFFKKSKLLFFASSFLFISLLPTLLPISVGWVVAERYYYLASLGFCIFLAFLIIWLGKMLKSKELTTLLLLLILAVYFALTLSRNSKWQSEDTLWPETVKYSKDVPIAHNNMGDYYFRHGDVENAIKEFSLAIALRQGLYPEALHNLGNMYLGKKEATSAAKLYQTAISIDPNLMESYLMLAKIARDQKDLAKAEEWLKKAVSIRPNYAPAYNALGVIYYQKKDLQKAKEFFQKALFLDPSLIEAQNNLRLLK